MPEPVIKFEDVSFAYVDQPVISNASFTINQKDFVGLIGPNGGGKTTLLKLLFGLLNPTKGDIRLFGKPVSEFRQWYRIGYVSQKATNFDQNFPATVFEVACMGRFAKVGLAKSLSKEDYVIVEKALLAVDMLDFRGKQIGELSGGQQQRVFIARALAGQPEVLVLDEPLTGVDMEAQHKFYSLLEELNKKRGLTLILVSHDTSMMTKSVNKIGCVNVNVTVHDVSNGITSADLVCAYPTNATAIPHHHD